MHMLVESASCFAKPGLRETEKQRENKQTDVRLGELF